MPEIPGWVGALIASAFGVLVTYFLNGSREREKTRDARIASLERAVGSRELAAKEDVGQLDRRLAGVEKQLADIQVMLGRLDERWKLTHGE